MFGLVTTGDLTASQFGAIHYDRGIDGDIAAGATLSQIECLHAAVHRVNVTST